MAKEYFPQIGKIPYEGPESKNPMAFHYYNPEQVVAGKKMNTKNFGCKRLVIINDSTTSELRFISFSLLFFLWFAYDIP